MRCHEGNDEDAGKQREARTDTNPITVAIPAGHLAMASHPDDVAQLIKTAAEAVQAAA